MYIQKALKETREALLHLNDMALGDTEAYELIYDICSKIDIELKGFSDHKDIGFLKIDSSKALESGIEFPAKERRAEAINRVLFKISNAEKAAQNARDLIQRFITFSKSTVLEKQVSRFGELIENSLQFSLVKSDIVHIKEIPDDLWAVEIDRTQMARVLNNIFTNAKEAMPEGGVIEIRAENRTITNDSKDRSLTIPEGRYVRIRIKDSGTGIAPAQIPFIFDPYYSTKERGSQKGMGLGLTIAYSIVQKHGGMLYADSKLGTGSVFTIFLPAHIIEN